MIYPSPLNYYTFPKSLCVSVNEVICHGIPDTRKFKDGDIVNLDISIYHKGFWACISETTLLPHSIIFWKNIILLFFAQFCFYYYLNLSDGYWRNRRLLVNKNLGNHGGGIRQVYRPSSNFCLEKMKKCRFLSSILRFMFWTKIEKSCGNKSC